MCHLKTAIKQLTTILIRLNLLTLIYTYCIYHQWNMKQGLKDERTSK